jgi:spore germination protein KA
MSEPQYPGKLTDENIRAIFENAGDFNTRTLRRNGHTLYAYSIDGLTSGADISEYVFKPIVEELTGENMAALYQNALQGAVVNAVAKPCKDLTDAALLLVNGFCVVLFPDVGALAFEVKTGEKRSIAQPDVENTTKGAKDAFVETIRTNTSLIRRHLRTPDLRLYETTIGRRSVTNVSLVWVEGLTNPTLVEKMKTRLASIDIDGLLFPGAVEEYITGSRATAFPLLQYTERTDRFCHGLLAGRVGLIIDGIPLGYLAPVDIGFLMDSPEDYGRDYLSASCVRVLRYLALLIGLLLPSLYVAFTTHHIDLIPASLLKIVLDNTGITPYGSGWEVLGLLVIFELLQESGIHLPQSIGQSISIIGGIVVGSAAVDAGLIAPMALITVSLTGVCGFVLPNRDFANAIRVWRFAIALLASFIGLWGIALGLAVLILHLACLKSLGTPYLGLFDGNLLRKRFAKDKYRNQKTDPLDKRNQK